MKRRHFEDFTPYHLIFAIIGVVVMLGSQYADNINHSIEGTLVLIGWIFLLLSGITYLKSRRKKE